MPTSNVPDISVVVPAYNEEENLPQLAEEIRSALAGLSPRGEHPCEVIYVDDGSTDRTPQVLADIARADERVRVLRLRRNCGQSAAFDAGFRAARGRWVVTLDADLQNDPADIPALLDVLEEGEGCDMVSGIRAKRRDSWGRRIASRIANRVRDMVVHDGVQDVGCSLKAYRAETVKRLRMFDGLHRFLPALVRMQGGRIREVPVNHRPRVHGSSKYTVWSRLRRTVFDLLAVRWMQSRWIDERLIEEIKTDELTESQHES